MKRLAKILKWIGIVTAGAITILLMLNAYFVWSTGTELERRLAALRQAGDPVQISDFAREPIPPGTNADAFLRRAADDLDAVEKELLALYPRKGYTTGNLSPDEQEKLEKSFASYPGLMTLLEQAADCPDSDLQLDVSMSATPFLESYIGRSQKHRVLYRILRTRCTLLLSKGRGDDALASQMLLLRLTRQLAPRALDNRFSGDGRVRTGCHGGSQPGATGRPRVAGRAQGARHGVGFARHDGRIQRGVAQRTGLLAVLDSGDSRLSLLADAGLFERAGAGVNRFLRSAPGRRFASVP